MRRGVTLLEVLFAIGVAALGLLGAIAVFPVALSQARKGRTADISAVGGESAIATFQVQGMHEPQRWIYWNTATSNWAAVPANFQQSNSPFFGYSFCIDPMLFAHNAADDPGNAATWAHFPAVPQTAATNTRMQRIGLQNIWAGPDGRWGVASIDDDTNGVVDDLGEWKWAGSDDGMQQMSEVVADKAFRIEDELMYERPSDETLPAAQLFTGMKDSAGNPVPGRRQEEGRLTWFATLVPKLNRDQPVDASGIARLDDEYVLSIVVCRDRASGEALHVNDPANPEHPWNEWTAKILPNDFHSGGVGGGEVTITTNDTAVDATFNREEYTTLKSGQWVMLGRTIPGDVAAVQYHQWYRVADAAETVANGNRWSQDVSLIGPDWPADVMLPVGANEECDVTIMPTVVHVYERTIRLAN
jgi:type II secretory pathway pseudopilin PulG